MSRTFGVRHALSFGAAVIVIGGCSLVTSYDGFQGVNPKRPPKKPAAAGGDGPVRGAGVKAWRFADATGLSPLGYDVDAVCTCPNEPGSCLNARGDKQICDNLDVCVDNQVTTIFKSKLAQSLAKNGQTNDDVLRVLQDGFAADLQNGKQGVYVELNGWDGQPNDGDVQLAIMNVTDVNDGGGLQAGALNDYSIDPDSLPNGVPEFFPGYVADNMVVVRGISFDLGLMIHIKLDDGISILKVRASFRNALFVGKLLAQRTDSFRMEDAQLTGAIPLELLQRQLFDFDLCPTDYPNEPEKDAFLQSCILRDLSFTDPSNLQAPCDGLSFAFAMDLDFATRSAVKPPELHPFPPSRRRCDAVAPGCTD